MQAEHERRFELFGSNVRLLIGSPTAGETRSPELAALLVERTMRRMHAELSRFDPDSGLSRLNCDPRPTVSVSPILLSLVGASITAAERSGGLVDPTLVDGLERSGYSRSLRGREPESLQTALAEAPTRAPAAPDPAERWREISVDYARSTVSRPPGVRIDSGGAGKGLAADLCSRSLERFSSFAVDCGGDLHIGGNSGASRRVELEHPLDGDGFSFELARGGVATSGLRTRLWRHGGQFAHHLLDPSTGAPAWTGLIQVTALAPTALEAETRAKAALLSGPEGARRFLPDGGVLIHDAGGVEVLGPIELDRVAASRAAA